MTSELHRLVPDMYKVLHEPVNREQEILLWEIAQPFASTDRKSVV